MKDLDELRRLTERYQYEVAQASRPAFDEFGEIDKALTQQNQCIEEDILLLLRAGIAMSRLTIGYHQGETKRSLLVDDKIVQQYTIHYVTDETECTCRGFYMPPTCPTHKGKR